MKFNIADKATQVMATTKFQLKKYSPEILIVAGAIGTVTSTIMACKATTKVQAVLNETSAHLEVVHACAEQGYIVKPETNEKIDYTDDDTKKDTAIIYAKTGLKFVKLYAPAVTLGALSLGAMVTSNQILRKRNVALGAALTAVTADYKGYRARLIERFGEKLDKELKYGVKAVEVEETVVNEDGTEQVVKNTIEVIDTPIEGASAYARFFDDGCKGWEKDSEHNLFYLKNLQNYLNDKLKRDKYMFLNDVYRELGLPATRAGQIVGWIYDEKNPIGDNYIDFGIFDIHKPRNRDFVNGYERVILLDFNVDGNILNRI